MKEDQADEERPSAGAVIQDRWIAAGIALLILLFLGRALLPGRVLMPLDIVTQQWPPWQGPGQVDEVHNPLLSDVVSYIYPVKEFAAAALRQGEFPLWNPYVLAGYPFTYNTQAGIFYPLSPLYLLFTAATAVDLTIIVQMILGGLFMIFYLRRLGLRSAAVLAGAIIFLFNGLMVVWLEWQVVHAAIIWLPLQLYFIEKLAAAYRQAQQREVLVYAAGTAVAMTIPWLGGHWNWTIYVSLTGFVYLAARLGILWWKAGPPRPRLRSLWPILFVPLLAVALSLVQVLPAVLYLGRSHRQDLPLGELLQYGLLNRGMALLVPRFFGDPLTRTWWGFDNFNETTFYAGILPLLLALLAILLRRDWPTRFFTIWGLLGLLLALGPLYPAIYFLPVFGGLLPSRAAILVVFSIAVLAALGLDRLLNPTREDAPLGKAVALSSLILLLVAAGYLFFYRTKVVETWDYLAPQLALFLLFLAVSALLIWLLSGSRFPRYWLAAACLLWLTADLFLFGYDYNPLTAVSDLYPPTATTEFLQADPEPHRMVTPPQGLAYPPNSSLVPRLPNLSGYEPGIPRELVAYVNAAEGSDAVRFERKLQPLAGVNSPLLDALNVKYLVTSEDRWGEPVDQGPQPAVVEWAPLPQEALLEEIEAGLQRLDVPLRGAGEVTLRVLSADGSYEFAHATAVPESADPMGWTTFEVDPFPAEWGSSFIVRLEGPGEVGRDANGETAVQIFALGRPGLAYEEGKTRIYLREGYLPRAYYVPRAIVAGNAGSALEEVVSWQDALDEVVVLELMSQEEPPSLEYEPGAAQITVAEAGLNEVILDVDLAQPGFVILADAYYPGWQAAVDGRSTPLYRANSVTRATYVPAGRHAVTYRFQPADFYGGAIVSGIAWTAVLALFLWFILWRRRTADV
ncbi:MAG: hypothetical protein ACK2UF_19175 [Candidatus Promineifilaceae bacterium]